jgi:hypothetical protein
MSNLDLKNIDEIINNIVVSKEQVKSALSKCGFAKDNLEQIIVCLDEDGDGETSVEELKSFLKTM